MVKKVSKAVAKAMDRMAGKMMKETTIPTAMPKHEKDEMWSEVVRNISKKSK